MIPDTAPLPDCFTEIDHDVSDHDVLTEIDH